jgi:phosphatidylserine/phosphatidylglycerophosphate/cardiolipin synthase-like enzyme
MRRIVHQSAGQSRGALSDLLQHLMVAEVLAPGRRFVVVSPWITDVPVIDNRSGRFSSLDPRWGASVVRISAVLRTLLLAGTDVHLACRPGKAEDRFVERLVGLADTDGSRSSLHIARRRDMFAANKQHEKALIADGWALHGSMNLTYSGVELNGELVTLTVTPEEVAGLAAELMGLFREAA